MAGNAARAFTQDRGETQEKKLYIADVPAGSRQDELRDFNRAGYRVSRPWHEQEFELFNGDGTAAVSSPLVRKKPQPKATFVERLIAQAKRERRDAIVCAALILAILVLGVAWGQKKVEMRRVQLSIQMLNDETVSLEKESEGLTQQITLAKQDERIRNLAQNELHMLRPERAEVQTIYIQAEDYGVSEPVQHTQEQRMNWLDILLGLLDVFHIGE